MSATLVVAGDAVLAEQRGRAGVAGHPPGPSYPGDAGRQVDRARTALEGNR